METVSILELWLPIVLSVVVVYVASSIVWMALPHHKSDWGKLPGSYCGRGAIRGSESTPSAGCPRASVTSSSRYFSTWNEHPFRFSVSATSMMEKFFTGAIFTPDSVAITNSSAVSSSSPCSCRISPSVLNVAFIVTGRSRRPYVDTSGG